ncbi:MAG TPA: DJ-1/PfpI family protein [Candidatus Rubrimentiphilum sp.]|nr:DJ-1/PfpI family protein [Candidatus Rubrimentiphilum sp.]
MKSLKPPPNGPVLAAFVVGHAANIMDIAGAWEVFQDTHIEGRGPGFVTELVSDTMAPIVAGGRMVLQPKYTYDTMPAAPNVIVMGAQAEHTQAKLDWIRKASATADLTMSVCIGAFLLARTGLLDGITATTHHDFYDAFSKEFPKVDVVRGVRYVEHDRIASAGGLTSGIELALRVVERYYGEKTAAQTANFMEYTRSPERPAIA